MYKHNTVAYSLNVDMCLSYSRKKSYIKKIPKDICRCKCKVLDDVICYVNAVVVYVHFS